MSNASYSPAERSYDPDRGDGNGGLATVRPQTIVGIAAEQSRAIAEIQAALTVAQARPRDEVGACDRIKTACQRVRLAEGAEYVYDRGGQEITGATIDLLTVIANHWGNIQFGFRELTQTAGESSVEAFAWDLETNSKRTVVFNVPHKRVTKRGTTNLTDPRDIYELMANNAQRRVRACLEAIIPPDVVEDAVLQCRATLAETAEVNADSISKVVAAFAKLNVTKDQLQARLGRRLESMQPAQLVNLRRIYKSITDAMSTTADWFDVPKDEAPAMTAADAAKAALKAKSPNGQSAEPAKQPPTDTTPPETKASDEVSQETEGEAIDQTQPDFITNPVARPKMDLVGSTMEQKIIGKRSPEELRKFSDTQIHGNPDLLGPEIEYLKQVCARRAWQLENGHKTTDRVPGSK